MPDQEKKYGTRITTAGAALITDCILAGTKLKITRAAAGDGGGELLCAQYGANGTCAGIVAGPYRVRRTKPHCAQHDGCENHH